MSTSACDRAARGARGLLRVCRVVNMSARVLI